MSRAQSRLRLEISRARGPFTWLIVIVAFGVIGAVAILDNLTGVTPFASNATYRLAVDDAKGITPGTQEVEMAGVEVGTVSGETLVNGRPVLTLTVGGGYPKLYRNAQFEIRPNTPLEDLYVDIVNRGTPAAGPLTSSDAVSENQTQTPVDISRVLDVFQPDVRTAIGVALDQLAKGSPDNGAHLDAAFMQLAPFLQVANATLHVVAARRPLVAQAMTSFSRVLAALGERDAQVRQLVLSGDQSLAQLAARDRALGSTIDELPATMTDLRSAFATLRSTEGQLDPALDDLEPVATRLRQSLTSLRRLAGSANPALDALRPALVDLAPFAAQLRPTAAALSSTISQLRPQAPAFDHITSLTIPCLTSISDFFSNTMSVLKYYDGYGAWPRGSLTEDDTSLAGTGTANLTQYPYCTNITQ